ncbi:podocalyxin [Echeneis naucrates]|uniref:Podocalyxin n=1 Tax=Echeneis naucrates TaxID=173247 RepID=A0A665WFY6_ECHNA|nr:podocalyxin [Echeneis naucrates]
MHLGEATSNRTRATMRITWMLLSLSLLLLTVCPNGTISADTNSTTAPTTAKTSTKAADTSPVSTVKSITKPTTDTSATTATTVGKNTTTAISTTTAKAITTATNTSATDVSGTTPTPAPKSTTLAAVAINMTAANDTMGQAHATAATTTPATSTRAPSAIVSTLQNSGIPVESFSLTTLIPTSKMESSVTSTSPHYKKTTNISKVPPDTTAVRKSKAYSSTTSKMNTRMTTQPSASGTQGMTLTPSPTTLIKASSPVLADLNRSSSLTTTTTLAVTEPQPKKLQYSLNSRHEKDHDKELVEVCKQLMVNLQDGNCTLIWRQLNDKVQFDYVEINGKVKTSIASQYYEEISKKRATDNKTLIAILASCGALLIMIVILAVCASHHRKPYNENQQHLTEELHTVENGYHDNPTLEVMEVQPEMQEKKMVLNREFSNDSWIVPIDNLLKEDIPDEEDTHL